MKKLLLYSIIFLGLFFGSSVNHAEAALSFVGSASTTGASANITLTLTSLQGGSGSSPLEGDLVIVISGAVSTTDVDVGVTDVAYTELVDLYSSDSDDANLSVNWKIMSASPDASVTCLGSTVSTNGSACVAHVWRGANSVAPIDVTTTTTSGNNQSTSTPNSPSITPETAGAVVISIGASADAATDTSVTAPPGYSNQVSTSTDPGLSIRLMAASKAWSGSGAEDPGAWQNITSTTAGSFAAATVAIRPTTAPTVTTNAVTNVGNISATINGEITATGGVNATVRGFAWGTNSSLATVIATTTESGDFGTGTFSKGLNGLLSGVTYYFRAYATNSIGTSYGSIQSLTTSTNTTRNSIMRIFNSTLNLFNGRMILRSK